MLDEFRSQAVASASPASRQAQCGSHQCEPLDRQEQRDADWMQQGTED